MEIYTTPTPKRKFYPDKEFEKYCVEKETRHDSAPVYCDDKIISMTETLYFYRYIFQFPNRFGVGVHKNPYTTGYDDDLWDVYILHFNPDPWCDYVPVRTQDNPNLVIESQTDGQVMALLRKVKGWSFEKYKEL